MKRSLVRLFPLFLSLGAVFVACADESDDSAVVTPAEPPTIAIQSFIGADNESVPRESSNSIEYCDDRLGVAVEVSSDFLLRPPGRCGATLRCGRIVLSIDPSDDGAAFETSAITPTLLVDLSGSPSFDVEQPPPGGAGGGGAAGASPTLEPEPMGGSGGIENAAPVVLPGAHRLRVALVFDGGAPVLDAEKNPIADEVDIELVRVACPGATSSGGSGGQGGGAS